MRCNIILVVCCVTTDIVVWPVRACDPLYRYDDEGVRIYSELYDSKWWEKAEEMCYVLHARIFPISIYLDETFLTGSGSQTGL